MLKSLFFSCLFIICFFTISLSQKKKNDLQAENFKGKVKSVTVSIAGKIVFIQKFDRKGNLTEDQHFDSDSSFNWHTTYIHNKKGQLLEQTQIKGDTSLNNRQTFMYDKKGNNIETREYESSKFKLNWVEKNIFDEKENLIENSTYNPDGNIINKHFLIYDDKGNMLEEKTLNNLDAFESKYTYKYNEKGMLIEQKDYINNNDVSQKFGYQYDEKGNRTIEIALSPDDKVLNKFNYTYEKYDKEGNWLKSTQWDDKKPIKIIENKFEYY